MANILITLPANQLRQSGNFVTADRWATMLRTLGHRVTLQSAPARIDSSYQLLIALHAKHSAAAVEYVRSRSLPINVVVVMTGTDLYRDFGSSPLPRKTIHLADRIVVLQDQAFHLLPAELQHKTQVIFQSATLPKRLPKPLKRCFEIAVCANLRRVKDPFRAEMAARNLAADSKIRISHCGFAINESMSTLAMNAGLKNPRYRWLGGVPRWRARQIVARSRAVVVSSKMEGGANVISEAIVSGTPVLASKMSGNVGMLGEDYSGYFDPGSTRNLADLLHRFETNLDFQLLLKHECRRRAKLFYPKHEKTGLQKLLRSLSIG